MGLFLLAQLHVLLSATADTKVQLQLFYHINRLIYKQ